MDEALLVFTLSNLCIFVTPNWNRVTVYQEQVRQTEVGVQTFRNILKRLKTESSTSIKRYVCGCFAFMCISVPVTSASEIQLLDQNGAMNALELELQKAANHHIGTRNQT